MATPSSGRQRGRPPYPLLTPAEERVLGHLRQGLTNAEIATRLGASPDAVKYHVSNMLGKLGLRSREELAGWRKPVGNPLRRAWAAVPLAGKLALGGAAAVLAGGAAWGLATPGDEPPAALYDGLVTKGYDGKPANGAVSDLHISGDGRYVVFVSRATNLVREDHASDADVFRFDRESHEMILVSDATADGAGGESFGGGIAVNHDGSRVAFIAAPPPVSGTGSRVFIRHLPRVHYTMLPAQPDRQALEPAISADGRIVAFRSISPAGQSTIEVWDDTGRIWELPAPIDQVPAEAGLSISPDGRWIAFRAGSVPSAECEPVTGPVQADGSIVQLPIERPFIHDLATGKTTCAPIIPPEGQGIGTVSMHAITNDTVAYTYLTSSLPDDSGARRVMGVSIAMYSPGTGQYAVQSVEDLSFCCGGPPALARTTMAWGPWRTTGIDIFETLASHTVHTVLAGAVPLFMNPEGAKYFAPSLSADGREIAYGIRGRDLTTGNEVDAIWVTSR